MKKRGELTPVLKNFFIILALVIAIGIVIIIIYNVVNVGIEEKDADELLDLNIIKNSVEIIGDTLYLEVKGDVSDKELRKIKFILYDGVNKEEITLDASDFQNEKDFEISLGEVSKDKTISVSIVPIIKSLIGERELDITDRVSISPKGGIEQEEIPLTGVTKCSKCGGVLGCNRLKCHSIIEECYYEGGIIKKCTACDSMTCSKYNDEYDCDYDKCNLDCEWWDNGCIDEPVCGDGICTGNETYLTCAVDCKYCGDGTCDSSYGETYDNCPDDCPLCIEGDTQQCGVTNIGECEYGIQTCNASNAWGVCGGDYVGPSDEICNGLDDDCDGSIEDDGISESWYNSATTCGVGACARTGVYTCQNGLKINTCTPGLPTTEICWDGIDQDCDGSDLSCLKGNGETCSYIDGRECVSGYCVDDVCCASSSCGTCQSCAVSGHKGTCSVVLDGTSCGTCKYCSSGTCLNVATNQDPNNDCPGVVCTDYIYGWDGSSCKKYLGNTSINGDCNGEGACYIGIAESCTGIGATSASCGSSGCKKACVANSYYKDYDSVSEVCYTSEKHDCSNSWLCSTSGTCNVPDYDATECIFVGYDYYTDCNWYCDDEGLGDCVGSYSYSGCSGTEYSCGDSELPYCKCKVW